MTIKDVAARAGLSHQAIYKRIKARGVNLDSIKDKRTGELTAEGEALMRELFSLQDEGAGDVPPPQEKSDSPAPQTSSEDVEGLRNQVAELQNQVEKLRNQVANLEEKEKALTDERDFLRVSLERSQQLQALTASKIPNPPQALPAGEDHQEARGLRAWLRRIRNKGNSET